MSNMIDILPNIPDGSTQDCGLCDPTFIELCGVKEYDINTRNLYISNFRHLLLKLCNLYNYENCPIPTIEIEIRLIMQGFAPIFKTSYGWVTGWGSLYGISIYNHFTNWLVSQPVLGTHEGVINKDGFIIYNTQLDKSGGSIVLTRLQYYTKMITDLQVSLDMYAINSRAMTAVIARDDQTKSALDSFYERLKAGDLSFPLAANGVLPTHAPLLNNDRKYFEPLEITDCIDRLQMQFSEEFGINKIEEKAERMVADEVNADKNYLAWSASAMASSRLDGIRNFNAATGSNVQLKFVGNIM